MRGPGGKGHAEMAVSRVKGSGPETPDVTPDTENFRQEDFENDVSYVILLFPPLCHADMKMTLLVN